MVRARRLLAAAVLLATGAALAQGPTSALEVEGEEGAEGGDTSQPALALPPAPSPLDPLPVEVAALAREVRDLPLGERLERITRPWLGRPYKLGPAGEAGGLDPDPVTRYDVFDCLTFVEQALALALAPDPEGYQAVLMGLRYRNGGPATYENRRHFMLAEWIPGVIDEGWAVDITASLPGALPFTKTITEATWRSWRRRSLFPLEDARLPTGTLHFHVLPLDAPVESLAAIPPGSLVFTMRKNWDHLPIGISHVGITVPGDVPTMRHASRMGRRIVRDDKLSWYMEHLKSYSNWPAEGIIVLQPLEFGPTPGHLASLGG